MLFLSCVGKKIGSVWFGFTLRLVLIQARLSVSGWYRLTTIESSRLFSHANDETADDVGSEQHVWQHQVTFFSFPLEWLAEISSHCCQTIFLPLHRLCAQYFTMWIFITFDFSLRKLNSSGPISMIGSSDWVRKRLWVKFLAWCVNSWIRFYLEINKQLIMHWTWIDFAFRFFFLELGRLMTVNWAFELHCNCRLI